MQLEGGRVGRLSRRVLTECRGIGRRRGEPEVTDHLARLLRDEMGRAFPGETVEPVHDRILLLRDRERI